MRRIVVWRASESGIEERVCYNRIVAESLIGVPPDKIRGRSGYKHAARIGKARIALDLNRRCVGYRLV